jgi:hypothetical protein
MTTSLVTTSLTGARLRAGPARAPHAGQAGQAGHAGQVLPFALVVLVLAGIVMAGSVRLGLAVQARSAAQAAADAAALAGAAHGRPAAERLAAADGARLVSFRADFPAVEVVVERHGVRATARAEWRSGPRRMQGIVHHPVSCPPCQPTSRDPRHPTPSTKTWRPSPRLPRRVHG